MGTKKTLFCWVIFCRYLPLPAPPELMDCGSRSPQATRSCIHISTGARQMGHDSILAEQGPQAHKCPHGPATCDFGLEKQTMHVVSPPRMDSAEG